MAGLLPSSPDVEPSDEPRVVGLDSDDADELIDALSSETTRRVLAALHEEPASASAVADQVDTSLQNAQYHLAKLEDAGLVEVGDTVYSEKGREMDVYVPSDRALVVVAGRQEETTGLKAALSRLLGGVGLLGIASVVVDRVARRGLGVGFGSPGGADGGSVERAEGDGGGGAASGDAGGAVTETATETPTPSATPAGDGGGGFDIAEATTTTTGPTEATTTEMATQTPEAPSTETAAEAATATGTRTPTEVATQTATEAATQTATQTPLPTAEPIPSATAAPTPAPTSTPVSTVVETTSAAAQPGFADTVATSPGLVFFLGGATVLVGGFALWWVRR